MRLTREALLKVARDTAAQQVRVSRRMICIYLTGSLLSENDPLLGGTTDIDLVYIQDSEPVEPREIIRLSDEVHLDISYYPQSVFHQPRHLRTDPWLGSSIYHKPLILHDTQHWFEFIEASTSAQFFQPDNTLKRANSLVQAARERWNSLHFSENGTHAQKVSGYLEAIENAGNAIACLTGMPLSERRFFLHLPQAAQAVQRPEIASHLIALLSDPATPLDEHWNRWLPVWKETLNAASHQEDGIASLRQPRPLYYERAADALWKDYPIAALWIMLRTWTAAIKRCSSEEVSSTAWTEAMQVLKLGEETFPDRLDELDHTLDQIEETLDVWGKQNGISNEG